MRNRSNDHTETSTRSRRRWRQQLDEIERLLTRLDTTLVVRDPGSLRSAEAYEGLRRQVAAAAGDRRKHLVVLSELAEALRRGESQESLRSRVEEWMLQASLVPLDDPTVVEAFDLAGGAGDGVKLVAPAYIDASTNSVVRRGVVERFVQPPRAGVEEVAQSPQQDPDRGGVSNEQDDVSASEVADGDNTKEQE